MVGNLVSFYFYFYFYFYYNRVDSLTNCHVKYSTDY